MNHAGSSFGTILTNRFGERYFPAINGEVFSQTGSGSYFHRYHGAMVEPKDSLNLIVGTDGGGLVNWLCNKSTGDGSRYLFIEFPELIQRLYDEQMLPADLPEHIVVTTPDQWLETAEQLSLKDYFYLGNVRPWRSLAVIDCFYEDYVKLWNDFDELLGQYQLGVGQEIGSRVFLLKCLENLAENRIPAHVLHQAFPGRTAVLLGGGPSLNESFSWIKTNREHLLVLAVTRIARQLAAADLVPDMFFAIDPHDIIFHQSKDVLEFHDKSLLVNMYHLNPRLLGSWRGRSLYMGPLFPWSSPLNPASGNYPGITVSHQALGTAIDMGVARIILAGFDLCFSREGFTHAAGSVEVAAGPYVHRSELWVETNGGGMAETRSDFFNALPALAALASYARTKECRVINPAATAAKIEGIDWIPWNELTLEPVAPKSSDLLWQRLPVETSSDRLRLWREVESVLVQACNKIATIKQLAAEAVDCNDGLFGRKGNAPDFKYKVRMDEIESILDDEYQEFSRLVKRWSVAEFLKLSRPNKNKEWSDEEVENVGRRYYEVYRDSAANLLETVEASLTRVRVRQEEEKIAADLHVILDQYQKDGHQGRVHLLMDKRRQAPEDFPSAIRQRIETFQTEFATLLQQTENDYTRHCHNQFVSPYAICSKVMAMFQNNEAERLKNFMDGIQRSEMASKEHFVYLIRGLLAEGEADFDQALRWYRQVTFAPLLVSGLQRLLSVHLRQGDLFSARAVARRLADRSLLHLPFYADLLRLTGDTDKAIVEYQNYVEVVQDDLAALMTLGTLLFDHGKRDGAQRCCDCILSRDQSHKAARSLLARIQSPE
ncbi:MAG: DUF115 domain-containing protein [Magnetococcales bacterium]|nr:DUF115 domain-containing protein [Magnetococcales bacterium]